MSWKDALDAFEHAWQRHIRWRNTAKGGRASGANDYVTPCPSKSNQFNVELSDMPEEVRKIVLEKAEATIRVLVDHARAVAHAEIRSKAIAEARATIRDLEGAHAVPNVKPEQAPPQDPTADVTRLGAALAAIEAPEEPEPP